MLDDVEDDVEADVGMTTPLQDPIPEAAPTESTSAAVAATPHKGSSTSTSAAVAATPEYVPAPHMVGFTYGGLFPFLEVDIQYLPLLWGASPGLVGVLSQA